MIDKPITLDVQAINVLVSRLHAIKPVMPPNPAGIVKLETDARLSTFWDCSWRFCVSLNLDRERWERAIETGEPYSVEKK